uniref:Zf-RING_UBOX domain-containing protein n=1 Tax=Anopheles quadriannulatus TaxID=34691 RepID=A0A182X4Z1_ANOQN
MGSEDSEGEESDRAPSVKGRPASLRPPMPGTAVTEGPDPLQRYGRRASVEASVVLLTNSIYDADTECPRKSSLWRNSSYSKQSEMDKQLTLQQHQRPLPGRDEVCPGTVGTPACSLRMMLMMIPPNPVWAVLGCLHTFCRACLEQVAATVTHGQDSTKFLQLIYKHHVFEFGP